MMTRIWRLFISAEHLSWKYNLLKKLRFGVCWYCIHLIIQKFPWSWRFYYSSYFGFVIFLCLLGLQGAIGESHLQMCYRQDSPTEIKFCLNMLNSQDLGSVRIFSLLENINKDFWDWVVWSTFWNRFVSCNPYG